MDRLVDIVLAVVALVALFGSVWQAATGDYPRATYALALACWCRISLLSGERP